MNKEQFKREESRKGAIAISIRNVGDTDEIEGILGWFDFIRLDFDDSIEGEPNAMTENQALDLFQFISKHKDSERDWVIHCEAGLSRSAAVAAIVQDITCQEDCRGINVPDFRFANTHVLRLVHKVMWEKE
jgi:predicted protein tyrosine phosphatase